MPTIPSPIYSISTRLCQQSPPLAFPPHGRAILVVLLSCSSPPAMLRCRDLAATCGRQHAHRLGCLFCLRFVFFLSPPLVRNALNSFCFSHDLFFHCRTPAPCRAGGVRLLPVRPGVPPAADRVHDRSVVTRTAFSCNAAWVNLFYISRSRVHMHRRTRTRTRTPDVRQMFSFLDP